MARRAFLPVLLLFAAILVGSCGLTMGGMPLQDRFEQVVQSVQPLWADNKQICTAWSLNEKQGYWVTAGHCIEHTMPAMYRVAGHFAVPIMRDDTWDVAVLESVKGIRAIPLSPHAPAIGTSIFVVHYAKATKVPVIQFGRASAHHLFSPKLWPVNAVFDVEAGHGASGSPIVSRMGVVSVLQGGGVKPTVTLGMPHERLLEALRPYVEDLEQGVQPHAGNGPQSGS